MSHQIQVTDTYSTYITSFVSIDASSYSGQNNPIGKATSQSSSYANLYLNTGNGAETYGYWAFDCSNIPADASITSVTCSFRAYLNTTSSYRIATRTGQLYKGTSTAKGSAVTFGNQNVYNITNGGTWTRNELDQCYLKLYVKRGSSNTTSSYYIRLYGAELTVNYLINGIEYEVTATLATNAVDSIDPTGLTDVSSGGLYELVINAASMDNVVVEDNNVDVTNQLAEHTVSGGSYTFTGNPTSYNDASSSYDSIYTGDTSTPLAPYNNSSRICVYANTGANAVSRLVYNFDCSSIPNNATITSVTCQAGAACYSNGQYFNTRTIQLYSGNTTKGTATTITGNGNTNTAHTINGGSWTREELDNAKIVLYIARGTSNTDTQASFSFWGATLTIEYTVSTDDKYWTYTLTNVHADHTILVKDTVFIPDEEDPNYNYYSLTVSSANANTDPGRGTIRVVEGSSQTIEIYPLDPSITAILDNGVDVSNLLVAHGGAIPNPTVSSVSGASYGFTLNSNTGYYVSSNTGVDKSAALCRVDFNLPVRCLVTIQYINYAEAAYDFGVFGNVDMTLNTSYYSAGSGGATITDSSYMLACNTSAYNTSSVQTLSYDIPAGQHYIYIKYSKDGGTSSNNDTLQWKIQSITPLEPNNYYTYTLNNISVSHSLIFIFGDVTYYIVNASCPAGARLFPDGSMVQLPGDYYDLTIVPDDYESSVTATDNGSSVVLEYTEREITKDGVTYTAVNYTYHLSNINASHNIVVTCESHSEELPLFIKVNGNFVRVTHIYRRVNGEWIEVTLEDLTDPEVYIYKQ